MDTIPYHQARKNFTHVMDKVCNDHVPIIITRQNAPAVVIISLEDFNAEEETRYLLASPENAARLFKGLHDLEQKKFLVRDLIDASLL